MSLKNTPMGRFDWERVIARAELPSITKAVAMFIAMRANMDGSSAHPGERWLADVLGKTDRYIRAQIELLRSLGLIERTAFGRVDEGFDTYQLTVPAADDIPLRMRLNPNGHRYIPRPEPKPRPRKAKDGPDATGSPLPEAGSDADATTGSPLPVDGPADPTATGSPLPEVDAPTGSGLPVDNSGYRNQASGSGTPDGDGGSRATGNGLPSYRKPGADLPEAGFRQGDPYQPSTTTGSPYATNSLGEWIKAVDELDPETADDDPAPATRPDGQAPESLGAAVLDRDRAVATTGKHVYAEIVAARRTVHRLADRDRWISGAREALASDGIEPKPNLVIVVAAELYRRSTHPSIPIMSGEF